MALAAGAGNPIFSAMWLAKAGKREVACENALWVPGENRAGGIRTHDPYTPSVVRYQTALQPVCVTGQRGNQGKSGLASIEFHEISGAA